MNKASLEKRANNELLKAGINYYPVDIIRLANINGIKVFEQTMPPNISGMIMCDSTKDIKGFGCKNVIVVNPCDTPLRRRFTIAHELAHFFIHKKNNDNLFAHRDGSIDNEAEKEADYFAGNLIMPANMLRYAVKQIKPFSSGKIPESVLVNYISDRFQVSTPAARIRLQQTNII